MARHDVGMQTALYSALTAAAGIKALVGDPARVYDRVPQNATFPYITLGEISAVDAGAKTFEGEEQRITIHAWSRYRGAKEAKQIAAAIYDVLHQASLTVSGGDVILIRWAMSETFPDEDGETYHAVVQFKAIVHDAE